MINEDGYRIHKIKEEAGEKEITEKPSNNGRNNELNCWHVLIRWLRPAPHSEFLGLKIGPWKVNQL